MAVTTDPAGAIGGGPVPDPWLSTTVTVPAARCGPPGMGNGGWVSGTVASHLGRGAVEVTLHAPTPLDTPLEVRAADDEACLVSGGAVLASARRSHGPVRPVAPVGWDLARAAQARFPGLHDHPFPGCFVCGTGRAAGDGLRIFPGPVAGAPGRVAAVFTPDARHAGPHGRLSPAAVWAALDCPTAWANHTPGGVALLGRLRGEVRGDLWPGHDYVVVAEAGRRDGRKVVGRASIYDGGSRLVAASEAVWITPRWAV